MWLAAKKLIPAILLPITSFFSFTSPPSSPLQPTPPATVAEYEQPSVPQPVMPEKRDGTGTLAVSLISAQAVKGCLAKSAGVSDRCLDGLFRAFFENHSTADALLLIRDFETSDSQLRLSCQPVVHAVGRETFRKEGTVHDSFAACDQTCHSGCYHGAMERFLRGEGDGEARHVSFDELKSRVAKACDPGEPLRFRFQCLHGLGHAAMFFSDYRLDQALLVCDVLEDGWSRSSCYGGLFMENVFSATPEKRDLSQTDYHYPCNRLDPRYRSDCYMMQTTRMTEMGLSGERLFEECRKAGEYRSICMQSIGRDLSNLARTGDPRLVAQKCELGAGEERKAVLEALKAKEPVPGAVLSNGGETVSIRWS